jgi:hypothetical protein
MEGERVVRGCEMTGCPILPPPLPRAARIAGERGRGRGLEIGSLLLGAPSPPPGRSWSNPRSGPSGQRQPEPPVEDVPKESKHGRIVATS